MLGPTGEFDFSRMLAGLTLEIEGGLIGMDTSLSFRIAVPVKPRFIELPKHVESLALDFDIEAGRI